MLLLFFTVGDDADTCLRRYRETASDAEARELRDRLLAEAASWARAVIRRGGGFARRGAWIETEDLVQDVLVALTRRLDRLRSEPAAPGIGHWRAYVERAARNQVRGVRAAEQPVRRALRRRLEEVLGGQTGQTGFALWAGSRSGRVAGFAVWKGQAPRWWRPRVVQFQRDPGGCGRAILGDARPDRREIGALLEALFRWMESPLGLEELVTGVQTLLGETELLRVEPGEDGDFLEHVASPPEVDPDARVDLPALWVQVQEFPAEQRIVFLLRQEPSVWELLVTAGGVTPAALAAAAGLTVEEGELVRPRLPLEYAELAAALGLSNRQAAINRYQKARERLQRRQDRFLLGGASSPERNP